MADSELRILLAQPRGFCAGVRRAIDIVERALRKYGPPVYVRHEIVHNKRVVEALGAKGARFVEEVDAIPVGAVAIFSAHGVAERIEHRAAARGLDVIDATCPLVAKVHKEAQRYGQQGYDVILIGHRGHPEVEGTLGRARGIMHLVSSLGDVEGVRVADPERVAYVTQTTLSVDDTRDVITALRRRFPSLVGPDTRDICYATQNRQAAAREVARRADLLLVVGAHHSSNSNRLREIGASEGLLSFLVEGAMDLRSEWLDDVRVVGITAAASAPEEPVQELIEAIRRIRPATVETLDGIVETVSFRLPTRLLDMS